MNKFVIIALTCATILAGLATWIIWQTRQAQFPPTANTQYSQPDQQPKPQSQHDIYPEVWTKNGFDGASYEFKVNCGPNYERLEECFLWDLTRVVVMGPDGKTYELEKDFNIQSYSGEVTRRWVLYGPAKADFPQEGEHVFEYYKGEEQIFNQAVDYNPAVISYPTNITWRREGNDMVINWQPPEGMQPGMSYKVLIFRPAGQVISQLVDWDAMTARLINLPLAVGERVEMNVSSYFSGGYAYPQNIQIVW